MRLGTRRGRHMCPLATRGSSRRTKYERPTWLACSDVRLRLVDRVGRSNDARATTGIHAEECLPSASRCFRHNRRGRSMLAPYRTLADPETQGEGSIDPLGLAALADHLADWMLPGMTARMWRPRFLTAIAVTSLVVESLAEELAKDGVTPPWLIFEWHYVEAVAALAERDGNGLRRIPGIDKARRALRDQVPLN